MIQNKQIAFYQYVLLTLIVALTFVFVGSSDARKVFARTGFEEFPTGNPPKDWEAIGGDFEVSGDTVKTDKKALAILNGADGDGIGIPIETEDPIISVEFYVYIEGGGRCFNLKVATADGFGENNGCTYINWDAGIVRLYDGAAWQPIGDFETDTWKYVRIIADVSKSEFDFYVGDDRDDALGAKPEKGLAFRNAALGPVAKWVAFYTWGITVPGYVDDLLVYEGEEALDLAVDPNGKLTTFWGQVKRGL
ncbi:hypothetical protein F4009_08210 [Candidatus Poribacteria bacterium]|nr:hypothetical protein [Candidatus Poribacteria bacterium]MYH80093.1 hypothetical protein [Candidatus Poribacteria bacterium]MYK93967.1 hypothetical protein [Candidatus Poribacteria bacterium]